jgi:hypothetical protein
VKKDTVTPHDPAQPRPTLRSSSSGPPWPSPGLNLVFCRREPLGVPTASLPFLLCEMEHPNPETNWLFVFGYDPITCSSKGRSATKAPSCSSGPMAPWCRRAADGVEIGSRVVQRMRWLRRPMRPCFSYTKVRVLIWCFAHWIW